jgi:hypothetical protein
MDNTQFQKIGNHIEAISYAYFDEEYEKKTICLRPCMRWLGNL